MLLHINWLIELENEIYTQNGKIIKILELLYENNDKILTEWAKHLRNHYCSLEELDDARRPMGLTRYEYLTQIKIPDAPMIKSGEFAEILVADYLQFRLNYEVPRTIIIRLIKMKVLKALMLLVLKSLIKKKFLLMMN